MAISNSRVEMDPLVEEEVALEAVLLLIFWKATKLKIKLLTGVVPSNLMVAKLDLFWKARGCSCSLMMAIHLQVTVSQAPNFPPNAWAATQAPSALLAK